MLGWGFRAILARGAILLKPYLSYGLTSSGTSRQPGTCASDFPASLLKGLAYKVVIAFVKPRAVSHAAPDPVGTRVPLAPTVSYAAPDSVVRRMHLAPTVSDAAPVPLGTRKFFNFFTLVYFFSFFNFSCSLVFFL